MARPFAMTLTLTLIASAFQPVVAKDLGNFGEVFVVTEPDFLAALMDRLAAMEADGGLARMEREMQDRTRAYATRPRSTSNLPVALRPARFTVDLSIRLDRDLSDDEGRVFATAGTVVNPLAHSAFRKAILFIDGDDADQVAWALRSGTEIDSLIVLTRGAPLELMRKHGRRFWFDQDGILAAKFQIARLPSRVTRADPVMQVEEVLVAKTGVSP
jgi:conjugal transfer pilus assembly protein TraW